MNRRKTMYPKVKVREGKDDPITLQEERSATPLRVSESLSLEDPLSPGHADLSSSPPSLARVPKSYVPNVSVTIAAFKGQTKDSKEGSRTPSSMLTEKNNKEVDSHENTNIRASPVPRPRAVLSSPDNDGVIGSRNQFGKEKRETLVKRQSLGLNTLAQGKAGNPRALKVGNNINTGRIWKGEGNKSQPSERLAHTGSVLKETDNKSQLKEKHAREPPLSKPKGQIRKLKPDSGGRI